MAEVVHDLVGAHLGGRRQGLLAFLVEVLLQERTQLRVAGQHAVDGEADRAHQVGAIDVLLHGVQVCRWRGGVGTRDVEVLAVVRSFLDGRGGRTATLGVAIEGDLAELPAVLLDDVARCAARVDHRVGLVETVHVGVNLVGTHADVVGNDDAHAVLGERDVVDALEVDTTAALDRVLEVVQRPVAGWGALIALADGTAADDDSRALALALPLSTRLHDVAGHRGELPVSVSGGVHDAVHGLWNVALHAAWCGVVGHGLSLEDLARGGRGDAISVIEGVMIALLRRLPRAGGTEDPALARANGRHRCPEVLVLRGGFVSVSDEPCPCDQAGGKNAGGNERCGTSSPRLSPSCDLRHRRD